MKKKICLGCVLVIIIGVIIFLVVRIKNQSNLEEQTQNELQLEKDYDAPEPEYKEYEKMDASYEKWLSAAVITTIAMENPDFILESVYCAAETQISEFMTSSGIYVTYTVDGQEYCVYSKPLESGRTESGTIDIFADYIGFATFEEVEASVIDQTVYQPIEIEDINTLIEQSERVTKYEN